MKVFLILLAVISNAFASCVFHATILRQLRKEGFHLRLLSNVEIVVSSDNCPTWENCTLALAENITSSFFVDSKELIYSDVNLCINEKVNVESPEIASSPHSVYLYSPISRSLNLVHADISLPLHLRYHTPRSGGGYELTSLGRPLLLIQCSQKLKTLPGKTVSAPCPKCGGSFCSWIEIPYKTNVENLTIPVPVGDLDQLPFVTFLTYALAFGGCIYLTLSVINAAYFV